jgi:hypothetical protein
VRGGRHGRASPLDQEDVARNRVEAAQVVGVETSEATSHVVEERFRDPQRSPDFSVAHSGSSRELEDTLQNHQDYHFLALRQSVRHDARANEKL